MARFTGLSLFSGVGATAKALRDLGGDVIAVEREAAPCATLRAAGFRVHQADVKQVDWAAYGHVDVITGGPPCQPFSQAHDGDGAYDPRDCIPDFIAAVRTLRPRLFMMEEVQTLTWAKHRDYLARVLSDLRALGYVVDCRVLNTADYGVPQARKRLFIVGQRADVAAGDLFGIQAVRWPSKREHHVTMAAALGWDATTCRKANAVAPEPARVDDDRCLWPLRRASTTVVGSFRPDVQAAPGYRKAGDGPRQNTPGSVVTTIHERLILQGLPPEWPLQGTKAQRDLQVGNSCPVQMTTLLVGANLSAVGL